MVGRIYKLINPLTDEIFYVGSTKRELWDRLKEHVYSRSRYNTPVSDYMHANNIKPEIELLEELEVESSAQLRKREVYWADQLRDQGVKILNKSRAYKQSGSIKIDWNVYEEVSDFCKKEGLTIGRFFDIAAKERLEKLKKHSGVDLGK